MTTPTTDPGHPFRVTFPELVAALEDRVRNGVEQPATLRFVVSASSTSFELPAQTYAVTQVAGISGGRPWVFVSGTEYQVRGNRLELLGGGKRPDAGSRIDVDYTYRDRPAGLTDFNAGSVISTLLRAVAHEMKTLYAQMDEAYRRGFIDQATGVALDNVVALLGIQRKPALPATGQVTFSRKRVADVPVPVPKDTRVADRAGRVFTTVEPGAIPAGALTVKIAVEALVPGPEGNAPPNTVVVMPTPPSGVDGITNESAFTGGEPAEPDDQLRVRAKHALERAGNATLDAIRFALLGVRGVTGVTVSDHTVDETIPLGEVWVRWAGEADEEVAKQVALTVERTRAAGVLARLQRITEVAVLGTCYAIPEPGAPDTAAGALRTALEGALAAQEIGEPLSLRRLAALAYDVPGLAEIAESTLTFRRPAPLPVTGPVTDPFLVEPTQVIRPAVGELKVVLLDRLDVTATGSGDTRSLQLSVLNRAGQKVPLSTLGLDVVVSVKARPKTPQGRPPVPVGPRTTKRAVFGAGNVASIPLTKAVDYPDHNTTDYQSELVVRVDSAAYAGLRDVTVTVSLVAAR